MFQLNTGDSMPKIGLGTLQLTGSKVREVIDVALEVGYRLFDTASIYRNEEQIGNALHDLLPKYNLSRSDIFITSKQTKNQQGEKAYTALKTTLNNLKCQYIDLYLMDQEGHRGMVAPDPKVAEGTWRRLVKAQSKGMLRSIGVTNYSFSMLSDLLSTCPGVMPAVNQIEWHPHHHPPDLKALCDKNRIVLQACYSLGGANNFDLLKNTVVLSIAKKLNKTPAQVLLRWAVQQNVAVIPKSSSREHLQENIKIDFEISSSDIEQLNKFEQRRYGAV